jgi:hypothetical protein
MTVRSACDPAHAQWRQADSIQRQLRRTPVAPAARKGALLRPCFVPAGVSSLAVASRKANYQAFSRMEPTGIGPVTSCLQSTLLLRLISALKMMICRDFLLPALARDRRGCTRIAGDYRGFRHFLR